MQRCLFCTGDADAPDHRQHCDGRQGTVEATIEAPPAPPPESLGDYVAHEHARTTDPDTSLAAAYAVEDVSEVKRRVMEIFRAHPLGLTDEQMLVGYQRQWPTFGRSLESRSSPRKRRSDLTRAGLVVDSGERRPLSSGRLGVVWKLATVAVLPQQLAQVADDD